jgi:hypothetical protein
LDPPQKPPEPSKATSPEVRDQVRIDIPKYFVDISDTKVDMLYGQIPRDIKRTIAAELKIELQFFGASIKSPDPEETRYSKLSIVTDYLEKHADIGSVDNPASYFKGTLDINWGNVGGESASEHVVFFASRTEKTILGLGGSPWHVLGHVRPTSPSDINSSGEYLLYALSKDLGVRDPALAEWASEKIRDASEEYLKSRALGMVVSAWRSLTYNERPPGGLVPGMQAPQFPTQRLEFLAKRLLHGGVPEQTADGYRPSADRWVLLGTPIYVAQAD